MSHSAASHAGVGTILAVVGIKSAEHGIDWAAVVAGLASIGVFVNGLTVLIDKSLQTYRARLAVLQAQAGAGPANPEPPKP